MTSRDHTSQSRYPCPSCSRSFSRPENLNRHQKTHGRNWPHSCHLCEKQFSRSDLLRKHVRRQHSDRPIGVSLRASSHTDAQAGRLDSTDLSIASIGSSIGSSVVFEPHQASKTPQTVPLGTTTDTLKSNQDRVDVDNSAFPQPFIDNHFLGNDDWFSIGFYDAIQESSISLDLLAFGALDYTSSEMPNMQGEAHSLDSNNSRQDGSGTPQMVSTAEAESRDGSPPNIPSHEDAVAFAWNPSSASIQHSGPIALDQSHFLRQAHNSKFDMNESTWSRLKDFLQRNDTTDDMILPSIEVVNIFIGLFFTHFYEQSPVLHLPTLNINALSPSLLSAIAIIGAEYSNIKHTRRFAILLLERARHSLGEAMEKDRSLVRDPEIIYAYSLMGYAGLWCGNKRAFEIAEASRGAMVTYVRRLGHSHKHPTPTDVEARWKAWIVSEFRQRVCWYVFTIDSQFPALLNMRSMLSLSEASRWECPCDHEFWIAPTARMWNNLLGSASCPPTPRFGMVSDALLNQTRISDGQFQHRRVNSWTLFLLLSSLASRALDYSHEWAMAISTRLELSSDDSNGLMQGVSPYMSELVSKHRNVLDTLDRLDQLYSVSEVVPRESTERAHAYFQSASYLLQDLIRRQASTSITDLQDALGKSGPDGISEAFHRLRIVHFRHEGSQICDEPFLSLFEMAIAHITTVTNSPALQSVPPYSILGVFLSHVVIWIIIKIGQDMRRDQLRDILDKKANTSAEFAHSDLKTVLDLALSRSDSGVDGCSAVLRHAANMLTGMGTWGVSLNLALLLQLRSKA